MNESKVVDLNEPNGKNEEPAISEKRQNKLLRLLGGKKAGNVNAASEWVQKSRTDEEEKNLEHGLEAQYNASLNLRLSGKARRHEGIGFHDSDESGNKQVTANDDRDKGRHSHQETSQKRDRSRSPLRKDREVPVREAKMQSKGDCKDSGEDVDKSTAKITKKNFYMQFTKSKSS